MDPLIMKSRTPSSAATPQLTPQTSSVRTGLTSRDRSRYRQAQRYGVDLYTLQQWAADEYRSQLANEESRQEIALQKMKHKVISNAMLVRLQSWFRMLKQHFAYKEWKMQKVDFVYRYFRGWYTAARADALFRKKIYRKPFKEWANEASESKRLSNLALSIFKRAVNNSKLTPQAVMAYFNPASYDGKITEQELNSIRRLMLKCLFAAWVTETKLLRISRFKAGQILTRTMRRTFGNLSSKETLMLTLHIWHRFAAVNQAELRGDPTPVFSYPYIPEWPKILQGITMKRIRKIRAADRAKLLIRKRAFKGWIKAIENDNTPDDTDNQYKAEAHYIETLSSKVLLKWWGLSRERGRNLRRRERCYRAWAHWAPRNRRLKAAKRITMAWTKQSTKMDYFRQWASAMHGIVASRTYSLRALRENMFKPKVLYLCYTMLGRDGHLMMLDCWQRWKHYWSMRRNWKTAKWKFRASWAHERQRVLFSAWKDSVIRAKQEREAKHSGVLADGSVPATKQRRNALQGGDIVQEEYKKTDSMALPSTGWYSGNVMKTLFDVMSNGSLGKLEYLPNREQFLLCCRSLWQRPGTRSKALCRQVSTASGGSGYNTDSEEETSIDNPDDGIYKAMIAMDVNKAMPPLLDGQVVTPKHIEDMSICMGDRFVPLIALLLTACPTFIAKRILLKDIKEIVLKCNNPLTAILIGSHISRWDDIKLTRREVTSLTKDKCLERTVGSSYQTPILLRNIVLLLMRKRISDLQKECSEIPRKQSESEEVALILKRQKVARMWRVEVSVRRLLNMGDDEIEISNQEQMMASYRDFYVGKAAEVVEVKEKKRALDPWITNLDLGSLLREYALLTGSLADSARQLRAPLLQRDDGLLQRGLERQARLDYLALKKHTISTLPELPDDNYYYSDMDASPKPKDNVTVISSTSQLGPVNIAPAAPTDAEPEGGSRTTPMDSGQPTEGTNTAVGSPNTAGSENNSPTVSRAQTPSGPDSPASRTAPILRSASDMSLMSDYGGEEILSMDGCSSAYEPPIDVTIETWWPKPLKQLPNKTGGMTLVFGATAKKQKEIEEKNQKSRQNMITRFVKLANASVARLVALLEQMGLPPLSVPHDSNYCKLQANMTLKPGSYSFTPTTKMQVHVGANLVELIHQKPARLMILKSFKWLPKKWWQPNRLAAALESEVIAIENICWKTKANLKSTQLELKQLDQEAKLFTEYLTSSRKRMVKIGQRTKHYLDETLHTKSAMNRLIHGVEKIISVQKENLSQLKNLVGMVRLKFESGNYEDALTDLEIHFARDDHQNREKLYNITKSALLAKEGEIPKFQDHINSLEQELKKHESDLRTYERQSSGVKQIFTHLAGEKFTSSVDIQELMLTRMKKLSSLKSQELREKRLIKALNKYCDDVIEYADHLTTGKGKSSGKSGSNVDSPKESSPVVDRSLSRSGSKRSLMLKKSRSFTNRASSTPRSRGGRRRLDSQRSSNELKNMPSRTLSSAEGARTPTEAQSPNKLEIDLLDDDFDSGQATPVEPDATDAENGVEQRQTRSDSLPLGTDIDGPEPPPPANLVSETVEEISDQEEDIFAASPRSESAEEGKFAGFHGRSTSRMSLVDFSKNASADDIYSLNRRVSQHYDSDDDRSEKSEEVEVELTEEQIEAMRTELQDEYWQMLEYIEKQTEPKKKKLEDNVSQQSTLPSVAEDDSSSLCPSDGGSKVAFEDEDDESVILRNMNRTARLYEAVKKNTQLEDHSHLDWPEEIHEETEEEIAAAQREKENKKRQRIKNFLLDEPPVIGSDIETEQTFRPVGDSLSTQSVSMSRDEHPDKQGDSTPLSRGTMMVNDPISNKRRRAVAKIVVMDPYATNGSKHITRLKATAEAEKCQENEGVQYDPDGNSITSSQLSAIAWRKEVSKISEPASNNRGDDMKDEHSEDSGKGFWPDGSPLGQGPVFADDISNMGNSIYSSGDVYSEEQSQGDVIELDNDKLRVGSPLIDGRKFSRDGSESRGSSRGSTRSPVIAHRKSAGSVSESIPRCSSGDISVTHTDSGRDSITSRRGKRPSGISSPSHNVIQDKSLVEGEDKSDIESTERREQLKDTSRSKNSGQSPARLRKHYTHVSHGLNPTHTMTDDIDDDSEASEKSKHRQEDVKVENFPPAVVEVSQEGNVGDNSDRCSESLGTGRSTLTNVSTDAKKGDPFQPILSISVNIGSTDSPTIPQEEVPCGPNGGEAVFLDGKWKVRASRRSIIAPTAKKSTLTSKGIKSSPPRSSPGKTEVLAGERVEDNVPGTVKGARETSPLRLSILTDAAQSKPVLSRTSTGDTCNTLAQLAQKQALCAVSPNKVTSPVKRGRTTLEVTGRSFDSNQRKSDVKPRESFVPTDPTQWKNEMFAGPMHDDLSKFFAASISDIIVPQIQSNHQSRPVSRSNSATANRMLSPNAYSILDSYENQLSARDSAPPVENETKPRPVPVLKRGVYLSSSAGKTTDESSLLQYIESTLQKHKQELDVEKLSGRSELTDSSPRISARNIDEKIDNLLQATEDYDLNKTTPLPRRSRLGSDDSVPHSDGSGPDHIVRKEGEGSEGVSPFDRVELCVENVRKVLQDATLANHYPGTAFGSRQSTATSLKRSEMNRSVLRTREKRKQGLVRPSVSQSQSLRGLQSGYLPDAELSGVSLATKHDSDRSRSPVGSTRPSTRQSEKQMDIKEKFNKMQSKHVFEDMSTDPPYVDDSGIKGVVVQAQKLNPPPKQPPRKHTPKIHPPMYDYRLDSEADDRSVCSLPSVSSTQSNPELHVQVLAKRLLERSEESKRRLPVPKSGDVTGLLPSYMKDALGSSIQLDGVDDDVVIKAYAAALGLSWDEDSDNYIFADRKETSRDMALPLSDLVSTIHSARQRVAISSRLAEQEGSDDFFSPSMPLHPLESPLPPEPEIAAPKPQITPYTSADQPIEYDIDSHRSCMSDHVSEHSAESFPQKQVPIPRYYVDDDVELEMRELIRNANSATVASKRKSKSTNIVRALSATHSANAILAAARSDAKNAIQVQVPTVSKTKPENKPTMSISCRQPQRRKIGSAALRTTAPVASPSFQVLSKSTSAVLPSIPSVSLSRKEKRRRDFMKTQKEIESLSASASLDELKREWHRVVEVGAPQQPINVSDVPQQHSDVLAELSHAGTHTPPRPIYSTKDPDVCDDDSLALHD